MKNYNWKLLAQAIASFIIAICLAFMIGSCSDQEDKEEDQRLYGDEPAQKTAAKAPVQAPTVRTGGCLTYSSYGFRNGRQAWKIYKPLWRSFSRASVRFSSGYTVPTVYMAKANRIHTGDGNGFCLRPMTSSTGVFIQAPYGDHSRLVKICPK